MKNKTPQFDKNFYRKLNAKQIHDMLIGACTSGALDLVTFLTTNFDTNKHIPKEDYDLAIIAASKAQNNALNIIEFLSTNYRLEYHADIKKNIQEILKNVCYTGNVELMKYLCESPKMTFPMIEELPPNLFYDACGKYDLMKYLLSKEEIHQKLDVYYKDNFGFNCLLKVATCGSLKTFKYLLDYYETHPNPSLPETDFQWNGMELETEIHNILTLACQKRDLGLVEFIWNQFQPFLEKNLRLEKSFMFMVDKVKHDKSLEECFNYIVDETTLNYNTNLEMLELDKENKVMIPDEIREKLIAKQMKLKLEKDLASNAVVQRKKI